METLLFSRITGQELPFTHYTPDNEVNPLPSASLYNIHQDRLGFIWLCVYSSGMVCYDGHSLELYGAEDGLANPNVMNMAEDAFGRLWVLSDGGAVVTTELLSRYDANKPIRFGDSIGGKNLLRASVSQIAPNALAADLSGNIWIGTTELGIVRYKLPDLQTLIADTFSANPADAESNPTAPRGALTTDRSRDTWSAV